MMLLPSGIILGLFYVYPIGRAVWLGRERGGWVQYSDMFRSNEFQHALGVTIKFTLLTVPLGIAMGLGLAVLADKHLRGIAIFRTVFSSTIATSVAVASLMWLFLLQPSVGVLANVGWIERLFPVIKSPGLLNDPGTALTSVALSSVWSNLGFTFILVTAALYQLFAANQWLGVEQTSQSPLRLSSEMLSGVFALDLTVLLQTTADRAEGVRAFSERRPPRFIGR
jgi:sn-glycerol 3-phosphate transport system permease protein